MAYELPPLPYAYSALEPVIDEQTMRLHHDKHHQIYVTNLNAAVSKHPDWEGRSPLALLVNLSAVPEGIRAAVRNNGGGHVNHTLFWETMTPSGASEPDGPLREAIGAAFGGLDALKVAFNDAGDRQFGSGWAWLVENDDRRLAVVSTPNQDSPLSDNMTPILGNDVWEHAYYLKYNNRRADYLAAWWGVVNWDVAGLRYTEL